MAGSDRILIIKMSAIGDVVHTLPFLEVLGGNFPRARIDWLVEESCADIVSGHPAVERLLVSRRNSWPRDLTRPASAPAALADIAGFVSRLRSTRYDLAVDLQGLLKSGIWLGLSRSRRKVGLSGAREGSRWFANEPPLRVDYNRHAVDRYLDAARQLGCRPLPWRGSIAVGPGDAETATRLLGPVSGSCRPIVAFNPMARWQSKLWLPERFAAVADDLARSPGCRVVFTGGPGDRPAIDAILARMRTPAVNLAGRTKLKELAAVLARVSLLVSTDTGPMHIAAAMGCPVVALFGPTAPWRTGPYGDRHRVIRSVGSCSACLRKSCPDAPCMRRITVEEVTAAAREALSQADTQRSTTRNAC